MNCSASSSSWVVGIFDQTSKKAVLTCGLESELAARTVYDQYPNASRVLLRLHRHLHQQSPTNASLPHSNDDVSSSKRSTTRSSNDAPMTTVHHQQQLVACSTAAWDVHGLGVATLLHGDASATEAEIRRQLANGSLPFVPPQRLSPLTQHFLKLAMKLVFGRTAVTHFGSAPYRYQSLCHFNLPRRRAVHDDDEDEEEEGTKYVALSLDDAPCRFHARDCSMVTRIQDLLAKYNNAKATFMVVGQWCTADHHHQADLISLLQNGHELANHGMQDRSYEHDDPESFGQAVDQCTAIIQNLQREAGVLAAPTMPWFRAPHGRYTAAMAEQLRQRQMMNVMCDTYASCPVVQDGPAVARQLLQTVRNGSIILLHMPEVHVRQWCYAALELLLAGLTEQGYRVVTISQLAEISRQSGGTVH